MGKSTTSCLNIITCARGDSTEDDDLASPESKASSDKRRWSFRKKSASQRVLSNAVISEPATLRSSKDSPELTINAFHSPSAPEKSIIQERMNGTSDVVNPEVADPLVSGGTSIVTAHSLQEPVAITIQAAVRGYLVRKEQRKLWNIVMLQAAVRGHLVRREAAGTLRCVQAVVKLQALVRARLVCQSQEVEKLQMDRPGPVLLGKRDSFVKSIQRYYSTEKLLSNGFVRQLLESTPKTKPIHINSDPSKSDSSWKWLERWMAIISSEIGQKQKQKVNEGYQVQEENFKLATYEAANEDAFPAASVSYDSKLALSESAVANEGEGDLITKNSDAFKFQTPLAVPDNCFSYLAKDDEYQSQHEHEAVSMKQEKDAKVERINIEADSLSGQIPLQSDATPSLVLDSIYNEPESDSNNPKRTNKGASCEPLENERKRFVFGSKNSCNPAFAAAQSKFEELSSTSTLGRSISSFQDVTADSRLDSVHSQVDSLTKPKELSFSKNSFSHEPGVPVAASECGTEISISSTLDSPDRSEAEDGEIVLEIRALEKQNYDVNGGAEKSLNHVNMNAEANSSSFDSEVLKLERRKECDINLSSPIAFLDGVQVNQQAAEPTASDIQTQAENVINPQAYKSSPEGSPRSHTTVPELHGTPSSQNSVKAKKSKKDDNLPSGKQRSQLIGKRSPSNLHNDSGGRSSIEHLPNDSKNAKRRNSLGTTKPDQADQEPRTSNSSSLPSYMQATESARAKANTNVSPKLSPDVHDKENHMKKRHSLPIGNGKQNSSPRIQISTSQAQQNTKGNDTHSPHNSAERRWQR